MHKWFLGVALALLVLLPFDASAQQQKAPPAQPQPQQTIEGVSTSKILAIGFGALLGVIAADAIILGDGVALVGGVVGGLAAAWWYDNAGDVGAGRASMRQPAALSVPARAERVALAE